MGGTASSPGDWPWLVALGYRSPQGEVTYLCGGALVGARHVVTAAHCVRADLATALLGEHVIGNDLDGANPEEIEIVRKTKHMLYSPRSFGDDIAVLELARPVTWSTRVRPICLPSLLPALTNTTEEGQGASIAGWGAINFHGPRSDTLLDGTVTVIGQQECATKLQSFRNIEIGRTKVCARDLKGSVDACQGDSGGPMMVNRMAADGKMHFFLLGVVSFGYRCAVPGFPGVYSRVTEYDDWIRQTVNS